MSEPSPRQRIGRAPRTRLGLAVAASVLAAGCVALEPDAAFPARAPARLDASRQTVAVIGDLQVTPWLVRAVRGREHNEREQALLVEDLRGRVDELAALVIVGDLVFNARSRRDWAHFDSLIGPIAARVPVLPALGNHDYHCWFVELCTQAVVPKNVRVRFPWLEPGEPYRVAFGDVALLLLDSETGLETQGAWLSAKLEQLEGRFAAAVIFIHRPPYTDSVERRAAAQAIMVEQITAALAATPLPTLVVSGHKHGYEHLLVDGEHFVVSAGGGGPRDELRPDRPHDVYAGPDCEREPSGRVLRPFNYLLIRREPGTLSVTVRGLCKRDRRVAEIASFALRLEP